MRILVNVLLIVTLPFLMSYYSENNVEKGLEIYCNERFDFCVEYSPIDLTEQFISDNGDGILLRNQKEDIEVTVSGSLNIYDWTIQDAYDFSMKEMSELGKPVEEAIVIFEDDSYECTFEQDDKIHYQKVYHFDNHLITIFMSAPSDKVDLIADLKEDVRLTFNM